MYQEKDRESLLKDLIEYSRSIDEVQGFLLVGSGSYGFKDKYSDLDVIVVVKHAEKVEEINKKLIEFINKNYSVAELKVYAHHKEVYVSCFFMENYLELDLGVWSYDILKATKPQWKVIFDKNKNNIQEKLELTLKEYKYVLLEEVIDDTLSKLWQFVNSATISIKRGKYINALKEIDIIRGFIIQIICMDNGIHYDYEKNIDEVKSVYKDMLKNTYDLTMTEIGLGRVLINTVNLYFNLIESIKGTNGIRSTKLFIQEYLNNML